MKGRWPSRFLRGRAVDGRRSQPMAVDCSRAGPGPVWAFLRDSGGTVLMESVMVLPLLLMLITGIFQFARFWQAKLLTRYAAYNAARAALVYNPIHYRYSADDPGPNAGKFKEREGVCWLAAVTTLSWLSSTTDANNLVIPKYGRVAHSTGIRSQVHLFADGCREQDGWVLVTLVFEFPSIFAAFDAALVHPDMTRGAKNGELDRLFSEAKYPRFTFVESCLLPKPWTTERFPHVTPDELQVLSSYTGGGG